MDGKDAYRPTPRLGELLERLGGISPDRVLLEPPPGTATEPDLLRALARRDLLCELVEGTLVEKPPNFRASALTAWIVRLLWPPVEANDHGFLTGPNCPFRLFPGLVRLPAIAFTSRERLPGGELPTEPLPDLAPDLAVEVPREENTASEMLRKRKEYFLAGTTLVWIVDPRRRVVTVYTAPEVGETLTEADTLDGGTVFPGLELPVRRIFERLPLDEPPTPVRRSRKKKPGT